MKLLKGALQQQRYDLAAHIIVYGMIKAKAKENRRNGQKRSSARQPKRT